MLRGILARLFGRQERRRELREDVAAGTVEIDGRRYRVKNWSSTGFLAAPCDCPRKEGDSIEIRFHVEGPGSAIRFGCKAIVVRSGGGELAGVFTTMDRDARMSIAKHFQ